MRTSRVRAIATKDLRIYYAKGPVVIFGVLVPAFFFLAFTMGRDLSGAHLASGLIGMALWFTATAVSPVITPWETRDGTLARLASAPISVGEILLGDVLASAIAGAAITAVAAVGIVLLLGLAVPHPVVLAAGVVLAALGFSALGVLLAAIPTDRTSDVMMLATLVKFPVIFVSGIFVPVEELPALARPVAYLSPLTYFVQTTRYAFGDTTRIGVWLVGLAMFFVAALALAVWVHRRTMPVRLA
ncbi:MAG: ABC transporter permease [Haloferacaceae archaeon]